MKLKIRLFFFIPFFCVVTSFVKSHSTLSGTYTTVYYTQGMPFCPASDFVPLIPDALLTMGPSYYTSSPSPFFAVGGADLSVVGPATNYGDGVCQIGYEWDADPLMLMNTTKVISSGVHSEFNIYVNSGSSLFSYWGTGNPASGTYDRATCLKHELGHAAGLGHSPSKSPLMNAGQGIEEVCSIDDDCINGYKCIWDGQQCCEDETGAGNLEISTGMFSYDKSTSFNWSIEAVSERMVEGFNIYFQEKGSANYKSLNTEMIRLKPDQQKYFFHLFESKKIVGSKKYYLEVVYEDAKEMSPFEIKRLD